MDMKNLFFFLCIIIFFVSCDRYLPDNPIVDESDETKVSLNELCGVTDTIYDSGYYSFTVPVYYLTGGVLFVLKQSLPIWQA